MGRIGKTAYLLGVALVSFAFYAQSPANATDERTVKLDYAVYIGGSETIRISFDTALRATDYKMKMSLDGQGFLNWWFSWSMSAFSEGQMNNGKVMPVRAGADSAWNGKQRRTRLTYKDGGPPATLIEPPAENEDRDVVPPALRVGARDLAGAVLAMLTRLEKTQGCDLREAVFDGRRRYNLVLDQRGHDTIPRNDYSAFSGKALRCGVKVERIAGYRRNFEPSRWRSSEGATLWIGRVFDNIPPVPVRMELDTRLGGLRAHLVQATLTEGGEIRHLAAAN